MSAPPSPSFVDNISSHQLEDAPVPDCISRLPDGYIWPENDRPTLEHDDFEPLDFPVVDMACFCPQDEQSLVQKLASACEEWGLFYVQHHGVAQELVRKVQEQGCRLFLLPLEEKMKAKRDIDGGISGYGKARIAKFFDSLMWYEGFTMIGSPNACITQLMNKIWQMGPAKEISACFTQYDNGMRKLALKIERLLIRGLGVDLEKFESKQFNLQDSQGMLQLNYYPVCPEPLKTIGLPAHTDSTFLTILHHGDIGGLQIFRNGKWIGVPPLKDALIVHVGDMLQILSNGKYKSVMHRAVVNKETARLSVAYLCGPPLTTTIEPACELVDMQHPQLYKPLTWNEYLQAKAINFMGALQVFMYTQDAA